MGKKVNKCCVVGCHDKHSKRHRFPLRDHKLFKLWLDSIDNPKLSKLPLKHIYKRYYVCDRHFSIKCKVPGTKRGLTANAVPTVYLIEKGICNHIYVNQQYLLFFFLFAPQNAHLQSRKKNSLSLVLPLLIRQSTL